ncbi:MAG: glycosyltransferase family 39 protein [Rhodocyclaceae bacterium]|nr:glycosyltransferase family 39 protein [Rhodocyclaceae bacterium]
MPPMPPAPAWLRWLILALPPAAFLLCLGSAPLFDVDEGAFSEATREMFERGDFLSTYLNGEHRFDKPILIYWLQALGYLIFGPTEWAFRLPSGLAAMAWCYATWHFARERFGPDAALAALAIAATSLGPLIIGRAATADALLNLLLALTLFDAWRHLESGRRAPLLRSFLWMGLGALTKGPIALLVPAAVTFLYCVSRGQWRRWLKSISDPLGWLIFLLLVVPWYAMALEIHGQLFIDGFILRHNVQRFSGTLEGHGGSITYYLFAVPLLLMPWTGPLFAAVRHARADIGTGVRRFLWIWAIFVIAFFSLSGTKLPHYVLYGCTPLFLLVAAHRWAPTRTWPHWIAPFVLLTIYAVLPWILALLSSSNLGDAYSRAQLGRALTAVSPIYFLATAAALVGWLAVIRVLALPVWHKLALAGALQAITLVAFVVPFAGELAQGPVKRAGLALRDVAEPVTLLSYTAPSLSVYRQAITPRRQPEPGQLAVTRIDRLPAEGYDTLSVEGGVAIIRRHGP